MTLAMLDWSDVPLDPGTYMWIHVTRFMIDDALDDRALLGAMIASPEYGYDYASPFDTDELVEPPKIHGRWHIDAISPALFSPTSPEAAIGRVRSWAAEQDWTDPGFRQSPETEQRLATVSDLLRSGTVYRLENPSDDALHEYGFVTGASGFHEFAVIDRRRGVLHLVVASDD